MFAYFQHEIFVSQFSDVPSGFNSSIRRCNNVFQGTGVFSITTFDVIALRLKSPLIRSMDAIEKQRLIFEFILGKAKQAKNGQSWLFIQVSKSAKFSKHAHDVWLWKTHEEVYPKEAFRAGKTLQKFGYMNVTNASTCFRTSVSSSVKRDILRK